MSVVISELGDLGASGKATVYYIGQEGGIYEKEEGGKVVKSSPAAPLPAVVPPKGVDQGTNVSSTAIVTAGGYVTVPPVRAEIDGSAARGAPSLVDRKRVPAWAWVAGGGVALLVTYMLLRPTRGIERSAPATAGLSGTRRRRRRRRS